MHMIPQQVFNATLMGLVLGSLAIRSNSLIPCVVFHFINNALGVLHGRYGEKLMDLPGSDRFLMIDAGSLRYRGPARSCVRWPRRRCWSGCSARCCVVRARMMSTAVREICRPIRESAGITPWSPRATTCSSKADIDRGFTLSHCP